MAEEREKQEGVAQAAIVASSPDPLSAMTPRFNFVFRFFARRFFGHFELDAETVARLRALEERGSVVYVMRYSSRLDYFLFNVLFVAKGLRLSRFANGLHFYYYRPLLEALRLAFRRKRGRPREVEHSENQERVRALAQAGESMFLFLRTERRLQTALRGKRSRRRQDELGLLGEVVREVYESGREVFFVPLAIFWRKGPRSENRFLNLSYGAATRPSDLAKVTSFLVNYRSLSVKTGAPIDLQQFIRQRRNDGWRQVARKVRRSILVYLYGEEKVVEGPTLRAPARVLSDVLSDPGVRRAVAERAKDKRSSPERAERDAEKMFREIAANMNSTFLAALGAAAGWVFRRMFASVEVSGLEKVAEYAKRHPLVLVPNHRSYFDFLFVSWLFYQNFLVPPHIVARDNMAFGPFGFLFRRAGAFFMRKSFDDPLYKEVFRAYVAYLVREGFTQEVFIEGGRSRTGKMLNPRFGVLTWDVEAFLESARRDLFFVPVAITYERLVEEGAMVDELQGGEKQGESMLGLVKARRFLRSRFGSVQMNFSEPISLADALGERRARFKRGDSEEIGAEKRAFVEQFGYRIAERINWAAVANATSIAAAVLLGSPHRGLLRSELVHRMRAIVDVLRSQGVRFTAALEADAADFSESLAFLESAHLVHVDEDPRGAVVYFDESRRRALDIYRNSIVHYLAGPSFLARGLLAGASAKELQEDLDAWQSVFFHEYFVASSATDVRTLLEHFQAQGLAQCHDDSWEATRSGRGFLRCLSEQTLGVLEVYRAVCDALLIALDAEDATLSRKELEKAAGVELERDRLLGRSGRVEAANAPTYGNVLHLLQGRSVLATRRREGRRSSVETVFARGEHWEALAGLRDRLAAALTDG